MSQIPADETETAAFGYPGQETPRQFGGSASADSSRTPQDVAQALAAWRESLRSVKHSIDEATHAVSALRATLLEMAPLWRSLSELEGALKDIQWEEPTAAPAEAEKHAPVLTPFERPGASAERPRVGAEPRAEAESAPAVEAPAPQPEAVAPEAEAPIEQPIHEVEAPPAPEPAPIAQEAEAPTEEPVEERESAPVTAFSGPRRPLPAEGAESEPQAAHIYTITVEDPGAETPLVPLYRALGRVGRIRNMDLVSYTNGVAVISFQSDEEIAGDELGDAIREALERGCRVTSRDGDGFVIRMEPR